MNSHTEILDTPFELNSDDEINIFNTAQHTLSHTRLLEETVVQEAAENAVSYFRAAIRCELRAQEIRDRLFQLAYTSQSLEPAAKVLQYLEKRADYCIMITASLGGYGPHVNFDAERVGPIMTLLKQGLHIPEGLLKKSS